MIWSGDARYDSYIQLTSDDTVDIHGNQSLNYLSGS